MKEKVFLSLFLPSVLSFCLFFFLPVNAKPAGTIHITQTTGQYVLNQKNTTYILDNDLTATGTAFVVAADTVTLDLNGHTVTFGTGGGDLRYGVAFAGYASSVFPDVSNYNLTDSCVIKNGRIVHGSTSALTKNCAIVYSYDGSARNIAVKNIYGYVRGIDAVGISFNRGKSFDIENDSIQMAVDSITNRQATKPAINADGAFSGYIYIKNNEIYGNGQVGIQLSTGKNVAITGAEISGNKIHLNGITSNPYAMILLGFSYKQQGTRLLVHHNRITSDGDISNRGILIEGIYGGANSGVDGGRFYSNYINVKEHGNVEYGVDGWTHGIRMRTGDPPYDLFFDNEFYDDTIIVNGYWTSSDIHGGGYGIRISLLATAVETGKNLFYNNVITAISTDTHSVCATRPISFEGNLDSRLEFYNNTITSNSRLVEFEWPGGDSAVFRSNTFIKGADPKNFHTFAYSTGSASASGDVFLDNTLGSGVSYTDIIQTGGVVGARDFLVKWYLDVTVKDSLNNAVSGAQVVIKDKNNTQAFSGTTDAQGKVYTALTEYSYNVNNSNKVEYNPYTVIASKGGQSAQTQVIMNASKQITIRISGQNNCPSVPTLNLPADGDTVVGLRPMLSLNNSVDIDGDILVYDFQIYSDSQMTNLVNSGTDILQGEGITYWQATSDLLDERWYWWKARSYDGVCHSDWSNKRKFYVSKWESSVELSPPIPKNPPNGTTITILPVFMEVYNVPGHDSLNYWFQLDSDSYFVSPPYSGVMTEGHITTGWEVRDIESPGTYYWRARVFKGSEFSSWSDPWEFEFTPATLSKLSAKFHVYPNPFKPSMGHENIVFKNVPVGSTIIITTLNGDLVRKFANTQDSEIVWDARNQAGKEVSSGVYLYYIGDSISGKIAIIR